MLARDFPRSFPRPPLRLIAASCVLAAAPAMAQTPPAGGNYVLTKQVLAAGGNRVGGGSYTLVATVGQSVVGQRDGAGYVDQQGFHAAITPRADAILNDSFEDLL